MNVDRWGSRRGVDALPVPAQQASDREGVAQAVEPGRGCPVGDGEAQVADQPGEYGAGAVTGDAGAPVEREQRRVTGQPPVPGAAGELLADQLADPRTVRDQAGLAEFAALDDKQLAVAVDIAGRRAHASPPRRPSP